MNRLNLDDILSIKEIAFICRYKLGSKLSEATIKQYIYKLIKNNDICAIQKDNQSFIKLADFMEFLSHNYSKLGFNYNPTIKELP